MLAHHQCQHVNQVIQSSTPPTLACYLRKHATHNTHASTPPTPHASTTATSSTLAHHPCKHVTNATHGSTNSMLFQKILLMQCFSNASNSQLFPMMVMIPNVPLLYNQHS